MTDREQLERAAGQMLVVGFDGASEEPPAEVRQALQDRDKSVRNVRFSETAMTIAGDKVIGTFRLTGERADGSPCDWRGCDLYEVRDGKIAYKDSYWKRITGG